MSVEGAKEDQSNGALKVMIDDIQRLMVDNERYKAKEELQQNEVNEAKHNAAECPAADAHLVDEIARLQRRLATAEEEAKASTSAPLTSVNTNGGGALQQQYAALQKKHKAVAEIAAERSVKCDELEERIFELELDMQRRIHQDNRDKVVIVNQQQQRENCMWLEQDVCKKKVRELKAELKAVNDQLDEERSKEKRVTVSFMASTSTSTQTDIPAPPPPPDRRDVGTGVQEYVECITLDKWAMYETNTRVVADLHDVVNDHPSLYGRMHKLGKTDAAMKRVIDTIPIPIGYSVGDDGTTTAESDESN